MNELAKSHSAKVDLLQFEWGKLPQIDLPLVHKFTPGMYIRQITMPKGSLVVSKIHKTTHPFVISQGHCSVMDEAGNIVHLKAPHLGITTPGTRRILFMHEETVWTTFHPGDWKEGTDPETIVAEVTEAHDVSYIGELDAVQIRQLIESKEAA
jgi:hypothetical protein